MKTYTVYFEIFGKKMKTTLKAESELQARVDIRNSITFHKVVEQMPEGQMFERLKDIFKMK